jgi:putative transposase
VRTSTNKGVQWRRRPYLAAWMNGSANAGRQVRVRWMPHHDHEIEVFDAYLGRAAGRAGQRGHGQAGTPRPPGPRRQAVA